MLIQAKLRTLLLQAVFVPVAFLTLTIATFSLALSQYSSSLNLLERSNFVLQKINELKSELGFTCLFISHDLSVVKYMSDRIVVMNQGKVEELAEADTLYKNPKSTYTQSLIASIPLGRPQDIDRAIELRKI